MTGRDQAIIILGVIAILGLLGYFILSRSNAALDAYVAAVVARASYDGEFFVKLEHVADPRERKLREATRAWAIPGSLIPGRYELEQRIVDSCQSAYDGCCAEADLLKNEIPEGEIVNMPIPREP